MFSVLLSIVMWPHFSTQVRDDLKHACVMIQHDSVCTEVTVLRPGWDQSNVSAGRRGTGKWVDSAHYKSTGPSVNAHLVTTYSLLYVER